MTSVSAAACSRGSFGLAPESKAALFRRALDEGWDADRFAAAVDAQAEKKLA